MNFEEEIENRNKLEEEQQKKGDDESLFFLALGKVLSTKEGRYVFRHLLNLQPIDERFFTTDVMRNSFLEGRRDLILEIRQILKNNFQNNIIELIEKETL